MDDFLDHLKTKRAFDSYSADNYALRAKAFINWEEEYLEPTKTNQEKEELIMKYLRQLQKKGLAPSTVNAYRLAIKHFYFSKGINLNIPQKKGLKKRNRIPSIVSDEEMKTLFNFFKKGDIWQEEFIYFRNKLLFLILYYSAARLKELLNLTVDSINLEQKTIEITDRKLYLPFQIVIVASEYLNWRKKQIAWQKDSRIKPELGLWVNKERNNIGKKGLTKALRSICEKAEIKSYNMTNFRETRFYHLLKHAGFNELDLMIYTGLTSTVKIETVHNQVRSDVTDLIPTTGKVYPRFPK